LAQPSRSSQHSMLSSCKGHRLSRQAEADPKLSYKSSTSRLNRHALGSWEFLEWSKVHLPQVEFIEPPTLVSIERDAH
jgi:hypothetical protein